MIKTRMLSAALSSLFAIASAFQMFAQSSVLRVYADKQHNVHVVSAGGKDAVIPPERGQVGVDAIKIDGDKYIAGWLVLFSDPDGGSPVAGKLVVWKDGRIIRSFPADQIFWSWSFARGAEQVAYHVGPAHGETVAHCELRDLQNGRLLASWDGDLEKSGRPDWAEKLDH